MNENKERWFIVIHESWQAYHLVLVAAAVAKSCVL